MSDFERPAPKVEEQTPVLDSAVSQDNAKTTEENEEKRREISTSMRNKLRQELISQGADPNYSRGPVLGNPILLISLLVAVLVIAGGKDILY